MSALSATRAFEMFYPLNICHGYQGNKIEKFVSGAACWVFIKYQTFWLNTTLPWIHVNICITTVAIVSSQEILNFVTGDNTLKILGYKCLI